MPHTIDVDNIVTSISDILSDTHIPVMDALQLKLIRPLKQNELSVLKANTQAIISMLYPVWMASEVMSDDTNYYARDFRRKASKYSTQMISLRYEIVRLSCYLRLYEEFQYTILLKDINHLNGLYIRMRNCINMINDLCIIISANQEPKAERLKQHDEWVSIFKRAARRQSGVIAKQFADEVDMTYYTQIVPALTNRKM